MTALNAVRNLPPVAQGKVVAVGWAFGGAAALQLFRASSEADGLLGVAAFSPAPVAMSTVASAPMAPGPGVRLALFIGSEDSSNRRRDVDTLRAELATSRALYTWTELGGAVAGFSQADLPTKDAAAAAADAAVAAVASGGDDVEGGTDNPRPKRSVKNAYDKEYDVQAWFQLRGFLMQCFGSWNADAPYTALGGKADYATGITGVTQWQSAAEPASN